MQVKHTLMGLALLALSGAASAAPAAPVYQASYVHRYVGAQGALRWAVAGVTPVSADQAGLEASFPDERVLSVRLSADATQAYVFYHGRAEHGQSWLTAQGTQALDPGKAVEYVLADGSLLSVTLQPVPPGPAAH